MSLRTEGLHVAISAAQMNLYPWDLPGRANWGSDLDAMEKYLAYTGYSDFEVHPTDRLVQDIQDRAAGGDGEYVDRIVGSMHQTFNNGGQDLLGKVMTLRGVQLDSHSVYRGLYPIQRSLSRPVPAVLLPDHNKLTGNGLPRINYMRMQPDVSQPTNGSQAYPGTFPVIQPCAEVYRDFKVRDNESLLEMTVANDLAGICPDTVHARRRANDGTIPPAVGSVWSRQFASGKVYQMHLGLNRSDMAGRDPGVAASSVRDFKLWTQRNWQMGKHTLTGDLLQQAVEHYVPPTDLPREAGKPVLRVVVEIPPQPQAVIGRPRQHARLVENLAEFFRAAGVTPILYGDK